jgi:hypothetical protein
MTQTSQNLKNEVFKDVLKAQNVNQIGNFSKVVPAPRNSLLTFAARTTANYEPNPLDRNSRLQ